MKLYCTQAVMLGDLYRAANTAKMVVENENWHGSRYPGIERVIEFNGYGDEIHSARRPNTRDPWVRQNYYAATWDQWGLLLAVMFETDPDMKVGGYKRPYYDGAADFHRKTDGRFAVQHSTVDVEPADFHGDHTFKWDGLSTKCTRCSARIIRF